MNQNSIGLPKYTNNGYNNNHLINNNANPYSNDDYEINGIHFNNNSTNSIENQKIHSESSYMIVRKFN